MCRIIELICDPFPDPRRFRSRILDDGLREKNKLKICALLTLA